jgi:cytochrome bd ubiquinol oxidase subunit II
VSLRDVPAVLILVGIAAYVVLAGADFGAGFWQLSSGTSASNRKVRHHAYRAMGPVWEANHVWLIFVLVVCWTAYPVAFGSITSTLAVPLFVAAVGIILRGTAYVLRTTAETARGQRRVELLFALSSILTPFALGAAVGGIASGRIPVGNATGDLVTSWLNPTSALVGCLAVVTGAYLAAVYLAADARRLDDGQLVAAFRSRALAVGLAAGAIAIGGLAVIRSDAPRIWDGLTNGAGLVALIASAVAGVATLVLVRLNRFGPARICAALAVAAIVAGWALAQKPRLLRGLTIDAAAAPRPTLVALLVGATIGAVVLFPSLVLLFGLFLRGTFDAAPREWAATVASFHPSFPPRRLLMAVTAWCGVAGVGLTIFADGGLLALGVVCLFAFVWAGFLAIAVPETRS